MSSRAPKFDTSVVGKRSLVQLRPIRFPGDLIAALLEPRFWKKLKSGRYKERSGI